MKLFIYEYLCCQPTNTLTASLRVEGWAMLSAIVHDFAALPGVEVFSLLAADTPYTLPATVQHITPDTEPTAFHALARAADFTLVIAPEFDELLTTRCQWVIEHGGKLLNPTPALVALTADKLRLGEYLHERGALPVLRGQRWEDATFGHEALVLKPRYGAGSLATFVVHSRHEAEHRLAEIRLGGFAGEMMVQPYQQGRPASVLGVAGPQQRLLFTPTTQTISTDGLLRYQGGTLPLDAESAPIAGALAEQVAAALDGLTGLFGVDLLLDPGGNAQNGWIVEVNPRLTTSYVGLRALAQGNLAAALLAVSTGRTIPPLTWKNSRVIFEPDGTVREFAQEQAV